MCNWIAYITGSSFSFALSDSLADSVLGGEEDPNCSFNMSPTQQMLISSAINFLMGLLVLAYQVSFGLTETSNEGIYAVLGGVFSYFSYYFLIMAFDGSSSTVILPLVQVSSIWTLLGSIVQNSLQGTPWLKSYWHLAAYALLLIGGLLPATGGNLKEATSLSFWKQRFVQYALLSEVCYGTPHTGLYDIMISSSAHTQETWTLADSLHFFVISRTVFGVAYLLTVTGSERLWMDVKGSSQLSSYVVIMSIVSELLAQAGFLFSSFAYICFYQVSLVHAAETALIQFFNLWIAYGLVKVWAVGKSDATKVTSSQNVKLKLIALLFISTGLFLADE